MIAIRIARAADAVLLPALERSAGESFRTVPDLAWVADGEDLSIERYGELIAGDATWLAIEGDGAAVGFLVAEMVEREMHIWEFGVRQDRQRRGYGRALFATALASARARGLKAITLTTFRDVPWNELLYQQLGFVTLERERAGARLNSVLDAEVARGLPAERRCAMRLSIAG